MASVLPAIARVVDSEDWRVAIQDYEFPESNLLDRKFSKSLVDGSRDQLTDTNVYRLSTLIYIITSIRIWHVLVVSSAGDSYKKLNFISCAPWKKHFRYLSSLSTIFWLSLISCPLQRLYSSLLNFFTPFLIQSKNGNLFIGNHVYVCDKLWLTRNSEPKLAKCIVLNNNG